jgi:hypothetical protein
MAQMTTDALAILASSTKPRCLILATMSQQEIGHYCAAAALYLAGELCAKGTLLMCVGYCDAMRTEHKTR